MKTQIPAEQLPILLTDYLKTHHLKQRQLAAKLGCSEPTLSNWLNGNKKPGLNYYFKILSFLEEQENEPQ